MFTPWGFLIHFLQQQLLGKRGSFQEHHLHLNPVMWLCLYQSRNQCTQQQMVIVVLIISQCHFWFRIAFWPAEFCSGCSGRCQHGSHAGHGAFGGHGGHGGQGGHGGHCGCRGHHCGCCRHCWHWCSRCSCGGYVFKKKSRNEKTSRNQKQSILTIPEGRKGKKEVRKKGRKEGTKGARKEGREGGRKQRTKEGSNEGRKEGREGGRKEGRKEGPPTFFYYFNPSLRTWKNTTLHCTHTYIYTYITLH